MAYLYYQPANQPEIHQLYLLGVGLWFIKKGEENTNNNTQIKNLEKKKEGYVGLSFHESKREKKKIYIDK